MRIADVERLAEEHDALCAAVLQEYSPGPAADHFLRQCTNTFPHLLLIPAPLGLPSIWSGATDLSGAVGIRMGRSLLQPLPRVIKRALDWTLAVTMVTACLPFFALIAAAIKLTSAGPVFYGQERIGKSRRPFLAWKFRTMHSDADSRLEACLASDESLREEWARDHKLRNDPRVTGVGQILRKTSLDELPQLWNVIRGEMSLVGPRPIVSAEVPKYGSDFGLYLDVPPGITGLWQVSGRNRTTYEQRVRLDAFYAQNWSLSLDLYILARTVSAVITGDGAY
jgi:Undecaprenyl-phosphate galactose phosphotransferase WbaP